MFLAAERMQTQQRKDLGMTEGAKSHVQKKGEGTGAGEVLGGDDSNSSETFIRALEEDVGVGSFSGGKVVSFAGCLLGLREIAKYGHEIKKGFEWCFTFLGKKKWGPLLTVVFFWKSDGPASKVHREKNEK